VLFVRRCLPQLDAHTLQAVNTAIRSNDNCENVQDLLDTIDQWLAFKAPQPPGGIKQASFGSWQTAVRQSVQEIVMPVEITWMEDDDLFSDSQFADRALSEIKDRFTR
jgi:hypothetical protein